ncbi:PadR family transcriptional regulator [Periweissella cryptocerci]|uniref:PadR family transcriptional regulator n=1 Tax=Periweissella cryptocerci TaxID=2506420 RepID=A0A4P6YTW9_9LACO|nr:PadR family transcriptional regulator [Periweissella cryptocerci]QBO36219.1 PadR family transcriptional regulator [Periweissella cryptocerci]
MYELYVLAELLDAPRSAYKMRFVLERILGAHRKVSFGVLYPLLDKMEAQGLIETTENLDARGKNLKQITAKGRERFDELMREPIKPSAHMDDMCLFKFGGIQYVSEKLAHVVIEAYRAEKNDEIKQYLEATVELIEKHGDASFVPVATQMYRHHIMSAEADLKWIDEFEVMYEAMPDKAKGVNEDADYVAYQGEDA